MSEPKSQPKHALSVSFMLHSLESAGNSIAHIPGLAAAVSGAIAKLAAEHGVEIRGLHLSHMVGSDEPEAANRGGFDAWNFFGKLLGSLAEAAVIAHVQGQSAGTHPPPATAPMAPL